MSCWRTSRRGRWTGSVSVMLCSGKSTRGSCTRAAPVTEMTVVTANRPAMDLTVQAMVGVTSVTGFPDAPPVKAGVAIADFMAGVHMYAGIVSALWRRETTGQGALVEVAMFDAAFPPLLSSLAMALGTRRRDARRGPETGIPAWPRRPTTSTRRATATSRSSASPTANGARSPRSSAGRRSPTTSASPRAALRVENLDALDAAVDSVDRRRARAMR